jgi:hypothetical protein
LPDEEYLSLRDNSTDLMYNLLLTDGYGIVGLQKAQNEANCTQLGDTLATFILVHNEISGCSGTGNDYSNIGYVNTTIQPNGVDISTALYDLSSFFDYMYGDTVPTYELRKKGAVFFR